MNRASVKDLSLLVGLSHQSHAFPKDATGRKAYIAILVETMGLFLEEYQVLHRNKTA